jgi:hypothetical protein
MKSEDTMIVPPVKAAHEPAIPQAMKRWWLLASAVFES